MSKMRRLHAISIQLLVLLILISHDINVAFAQGKDIVVPMNTRTKSYGSGWVCERGYIKVDNNCTAITVPEHAYLSNASYGDVWKCNWGYRKQKDACIAINIPANAYLDSYGSHWLCKRGYYKKQKTCVAVEVPVNGYFVESTYQPGWKCKRGYKAKKEACVVVNLPKNSHLDYSGSNWDCNPPYIKQQNKCELLGLTQ